MAGATLPSVKEKARAIKTDTKAIRVEYSVRACARLRLLTRRDGVFHLLSTALLLHWGGAVIALWQEPLPDLGLFVK